MKKNYKTPTCKHKCDVCDRAFVARTTAKHCSRKCSGRAWVKRKREGGVKPKLPAKGTPRRKRSVQMISNQNKIMHSTGNKCVALIKRYQEQQDLVAILSGCSAWRGNKHGA